MYIGEKDLGYKQIYLELCNNNNEKDLRITLGKILDVSDFLHQKYIDSRDNDMSMDETEFRLTRKEENGIINIIIKKLNKFI